MKYLFLFLLTSTTLVAQVNILPANEADCIKQGGQWSIVGLFPKPSCTFTSKDAGKECENSSECESACIAPEDKKAGEKSKGTCYHKSHTIGTCLSRVEKGIVGPRLCID